MKNFLFFLGFVCFFYDSPAQCPFPVSLQTKSGYCVGDTLFVNSANALSSITWYQGTAVVKAVTAVNLGSGITVAGGNGMGTAANQFFSPQNVYGDASGNIYVSDAMNNRIQKFPPGSTSATNGITVAGGNGLGSAADQLWNPLNVFSDNSGNLYIADVFNQRIQEWTVGATSGLTVAGGNGAGAATNQFNDPYAVFVDASGNMYVADWMNSRVQKWAPGATSGITVAGGNGAGPAANQLNLPTNVFVDGAGNIYITDRTNERIQKWAPGATSGVTVAGGNGIGAAANQLDAPYGIFVDASGYLYVADYSNSRVQKFPPGSTGATNGVTVAGGNGFGNAANQFDGPSGVYVDNAGSIYVCDENNERIQKWEQVRIDTIYVPSSPGSYTAQVVDNSSCTVTTLPIVINPVLSASVSIAETANTICSGTGSFNATVTNGGSAPVYQWQINGVNSGTNSPAFAVSALAKGDQVNCLLTSNALCALPANVSSNIIQISGPPVFYLLNKGNQCLGKDTLMISSTDTISQIIWYNGTTIAYTENTAGITSYIPLTAGNYTAVVTNNAGCVSTSPAIDINPTTVTSVQIQIAQSEICAGSPANFSVSAAVGGTAPVFQWQLNGVDVGTNSNVYTNNNLADSAQITCIMTNNAVCPLQAQDTSNTIKMKVNPPLVPTIQISATDSVICKGKPVTFQATAKNAGTNISYQWTVNAVNAGNNNAVFSSSLLNDGDLVSCLLTADPLAACVNPSSVHSNAVTMHVSDSLQPSIQISSSALEICPGDAVIFQAISQHAGNAPLYQWMLNGKPVGDNEDRFSSSSIQDGDQVSCLLTAVNATCSAGSAVASNTEQLTVKAAPQITAITPDTSIRPHQQVKLNVTVSGATSSYQWTPADKLTDPGVLNPTTIPLGQTTSFYFVVTGTDGCESGKTVVVKVPVKLNMPNAFSPNGDQKNDVFRIPPNTFINLKEFTIYDRWGARVFSSRDISKGWDGNFNGTPCVTGTYVYIVSGTDDSGAVFQKGTVVLIR